MTIKSEIHKSLKENLYLALKCVFFIFIVYINAL